MHKSKKLVVCALGGVFAATALLGGCSNPMFNFEGYDYPDYPYADSDDTIDSWEQWEDGDIVEIDWYIDNTSYSTPLSDTVVVNEILRKTGVKINFKTATTSDGTELTTMIAGNDLPDVLSVTSGMYDLIMEQNIFPINGLAERWAPSLWRRITEEGEMYNMYRYSDDNLYFIVNNFYNTKQIEEYRLLGNDMLPNDGVVVRKDYLDAYCAYRKGQNPAWTDAEMANPQGVLDFLLWTKAEYGLSNSNHSVLLSAFDSSEPYGSRGIKVLMEYFDCAAEDAEGNYVYPLASDNFTEMMQWLNALYRNNLLTEGCLGATQGQINTYIQNGEPIMYAGKMVTPSSYFRNWEQNTTGNNPAGKDAAYVPIVFTNAAGEIPQLAFNSAGELYTMVTSNCERPDRVIKLLDYLYSDEGQRLVYYGVDADEDSENGTFVYTVQPGTTVTLSGGTSYTYKFGQIDYTDEVKTAFMNSVESYGIYFCMFLCNPMYMNLTSVSGGQFNNYRDYVKWNSRSALIPYTYDYRGFSFVLDASDARYKTALTAQSNIRSKWYTKYAEIIGLPSAEDVAGEIQSLLAWCEKANLSTWIDLSNDCFRAQKERLGISYAYAPNDPTSSYHSLTISSVYGDTSYYKTAPSYMTGA